jgi:hypothetical protein
MLCLRVFRRYISCSLPTIDLSAKNRTYRYIEKLNILFTVTQHEDKNHIRAINHYNI